MTHNQHNNGLGTPPMPRQNYETRLAGWAIGAIFTALITWPIITAISAFPTLAPGAVRRRAISGEPSRHPRMNALSIALWRSGIFMLLSAFIPVLLIITAPASVIIAGQAVGAKVGEPITTANIYNGIRGLIHTRTARNGGAFAGILALAAVVAWIVAATANGVGGGLYLVLGAAAVIALAYTGIALATQAVTEAVSAAQDSRTRLELVTERIAGALGVNPRTLAELHAVEARIDGSWVVSPAPVSAVNAGLAKVEEAVGKFFPELTVVAFDHTVVAAGTATPDVLDARAAVAESGGLVTGFEDVEDSEVRPEHAIWHLADGVSPAAAEKVSAFARRRGISLVEWLPYDGLAHVAKLSTLTVQVREVLANALGARSWEVEALVETSAEHAVESVEIVRMPAMDGARAHELLTQAALRLPDGSEGWKVAVDAVGGTAVMRFGEKPELPSLVEGRELLPKPGEKTSWSAIPVGHYVDGTEMVLDLRAGPHTLVIGGTGAGKSTFIRVMLTQALVRGFELVFADAVKRGAGLYGFEPYARAWETSGSRDAVAALMQSVYAEVTRRVNLIAEHRAEDWRDLPSELGIRPMLVVIDEFRGHVTTGGKPAGPKDSEVYQRWEAKAAAAGIILDAVGSMASEARSAGVHLVLITQRPDTTIIPGDVRENLGTVAQLVSPTRPPTRQALAMAFSDDSALVQAAQEQIRIFNDGRSPGYVVTAVEGGNVGSARAGYLRFNAQENVDEALAILTERGVPHGVPLAYDVPDTASDNDGAAGLSFDLSDL